MGSLQMDEDDEIPNLVDLYIYVLCGGWKWQDLLRLALVDHHRTPISSYRSLIKLSSKELIELLSSGLEAKEPLGPGFKPLTQQEWLGSEATRNQDADYAGCQDTRKSTSGSAQFLRDKLVSWSSKKQKSTDISTTEAEYIAMSGCYAQIL
ncbi:retrovirus-related pol polyprotein from transposon TNT 1-94 [Tanacetum coccineum]